MISISRARRVAVGIAATAALALIPTLTASAHVTVSSPDASPGGFGKIVFRVPSESDTANTVSVTVDLPTDTPFAFVSVGVVPGWTAEMETTTLPEPVEVAGFTITEAVSSVTWTADGDGLAPHQFTEFALSGGPFPTGVDELVFPATQTYSDGEVVHWDQTAEGGEEPEHPAPTLVLSGDGSSGSGSHGSSDDAEATDSASDSASDDGGDDSSTDTLARVLGIVGIVLGGAGLAYGVTARRGSKPAA